MSLTSASPADSRWTTRWSTWRQKSGAPSRNRTPWLFLLPHLSLFMLWTVLPLLGVAVMSLFDWNLLGDRRYIALGNYEELAGDRLFWIALGNTARFALVVVPSSLAAGLALALALDSQWRGRVAARAMLYAPGVVSGVASATVAAWILNDHYGVVNHALGALGLPRPNWLSSQRWAFWALSTVTLWTRVGFCMVVYLAGLQEIPRELYDAAAVDGAGPWQRFRHITWPGLRRTTVLLGVLTIVFSFHVFDLAYIMTAGGPAFSTTMLVQYIFEAGFALQRQGYAAALSIFLFALMLAASVVLLRAQRTGRRP